MITEKDRLCWYILVTVDNSPHIHTLALIKKVKEFIPETDTDEIKIRKTMNDLNEHLKLDPFGWTLTRSGVEYLKQLQTQMDLYFNPNFEDGHAVWLDVLHYLLDTKTVVSEKMLTEIQKKVVKVIEKYRAN